MADKQKNTRGGSLEQHAEAGRQSHKNQEGNTRGGTPEQHAAAGRKGGEASRSGGSQSGSSGRGFAGMDPEQQRIIASKGGKAAHESGRAHEFNSAEAREAGRKGGENSRGGGGANR
jgi:general stress protein YciG